VPPRPLLVFAQDDAWESRFQVSSLAASAAAAGQTVQLVLFFAALAAWVEERWDDPQPARVVTAARLAALDLPPLSTYLAPYRQGDTVAAAAGSEPTVLIRLYACSASVRILGLDPAAVQARVDVLAGWPTFHRLARGAEQVVTF